MIAGSSAVVLGVALMFCPPHAAAGEPLVVTMGTIAPEGSIWHEAMLRIREQWRTLSGGEVELRIYAGGVLGGEAEMVRKVRRRGLDAITISGSGLTHIDSSLDCLNAPMTFDTYEELEYVRDAVAPMLERRLAKKRFMVLGWAEAGWVYFFAKEPVRIPEDLRRLRLWTSAGHPETEQLFKELGFKVVPLPATDMLTGLQTGLIDAIDVPPLFALLDRSYQIAKYMTDLRFAPLNAATVIRVDVWERVPETYRTELREAARKVARRLRADIRQADRDAIAEMTARGLEVVALDASEVEVWKATAEKAYPGLECNLKHPALFQDMLRLRDEHRRQ